MVIKPKKGGNYHYFLKSIKIELVYEVSHERSEWLPHIPSEGYLSNINVIC